MTRYRTNSGSFRKRGKKGKKPGVQTRGPIVVLFFWIVVWVLFGVMFGVYADNVKNIVLWNDLFTLFGAISYNDMFIGILTGTVFIGVLHIVYVTFKGDY